MTHQNKLHNPSTIAPPARNLYAHAVEVPKASRHHYVAGQVGVRPDGSVPESLEEQTEQMMENTCLRNIGVSATFCTSGL